MTKDFLSGTPSGVRPEPGQDSPGFSACRMIRIVRADMIPFLIYFRVGFTLVWDNPILARFRVAKNNNIVEKLRRASCEVSSLALSSARAFQADKSGQIR